jgi:hypothetical protein
MNYLVEINEKKLFTATTWGQEFINRGYKIFSVRDDPGIYLTIDVKK